MSARRPGSGSGCWPGPPPRRRSCSPGSPWWTCAITVTTWICPAGRSPRAYAEPVIIDLHTHSTASDGTDSPAALIEVAAGAGLDVVALTDHDSTAGWPAATEAARRLGVTLVPGAEISCQMGTIAVHMLAYLFDPADQALLAETSRTRTDRLERAQRMVQRMSRDLDITWADVLEHVDSAATVGRPH